MFRILGLLSLMAAPVAAQTLESEAGPVRLSLMAEGFDTPWAIGLLPDGSFLVTERDGALWHVADDRRQRVSGLPDVAAIGQGGLLDITVARDFATSREIWLSYSKPQAGGGAGTALASARLDPDNSSLSGLTDLFVMQPGSKGGRHFGSRVVEAADGTLLLTIGDRGDRPSAQDLSVHSGKIVRVARDGSVPRDNPFLGTPGALPEIWSYGHRNPQGAGLDAQGRLWTAEHGARGGDEVNRPRAGENHGWPVISYGRHYSGAKIGEGTARADMRQPEFYWDPSIAPSGLLVYSGRLWPEWAGDIFVGSLKFDYISRLDGAPLREVERLQSDETIRVRDLAEDDAGAIWFLSESDGAVYRMTPAR